MVTDRCSCGRFCWRAAFLTTALGSAGCERGGIICPVTTHIFPVTTLPRRLISAKTTPPRGELPHERSCLHCLATWRKFRFVGGVTVEVSDSSDVATSRFTGGGGASGHGPSGDLAAGRSTCVSCSGSAPMQGETSPSARPARVRCSKDGDRPPHRSRSSRNWRRWRRRLADHWGQFSLMPLSTWRLRNRQAHWRRWRP